MIFKAPGIAICAVTSLWSFFLCEKLLYDVGGFSLICISVLLAPFFLYLAPLYAAFLHGQWLALALAYSGLIVGGLLFAAGARIDRRIAADEPPQRLKVF